MEEIPPLPPGALKYYRKCVPGLHKVDGVPWHDTMFPLDDFEMRDDDVLVTGYPKSGNNWLGEIVYMILMGGDEAIANRKKIEERIHWLELDPVRPERDSIDRFSEYPSPRVLMTHNPSRQCPPRKNKKFKTVVIVRNPKDVVVSYFKFHQMLDFIRYDDSWEDFLLLFLHGEVMHGLWFDVVLDWWKQRDDPNVCFVKYEDLKKDLTAGVKKLAAFLGVTLGTKQVSDIVRHCTFDNMKANPMSNLSTEFMDESVSPFLRKGVIGDWKNHFTVAQSEMFDKLYEKKMKDSGLKLEFE